MHRIETGEQMLHDYLQKVRAGLRGLPDSQSTEILEELRSHVRESVPASGALPEREVQAALKRLGPAEELARMYVAEAMLRPAAHSRSPWLILRTMFRWAKLSTAGVLVFLVSVVSLMLSASFMIAALAKPFNPTHVGLWKATDDTFSLALGFRSASNVCCTELLGWWIVPIGLSIGGGLFLLTIEFDKWAMRTFSRRPLTRG